jgi:DNA-binding NarL/FixJ family response regulator
VIRILLVDDHVSTREPLAFMLEQEPDLTVVAQAGCVAEARRALGEAGAAVEDLGLPDGSGEELIPVLRATHLRALALVLTYFSDRERLARAVEAGASGVLHKSSSVEEIVEAVRRLHSGEQLLSIEEVFEALRLVDRERRKDREARSSFEKLTDRELEVLRALAEGLSDREISNRFHVGAATVRTHVTSILAKLGAASRLQALVLAVRHGVVKID